jgi:ABC-type multidrug transport system ATPase subunit
MQDDVFFTNLSVREQLIFTSRLRSKEDPSHSSEALVASIVAVLSLDRCIDTPIALVSGGERKRCNIATELLTSPSIVLLDEPTSGNIIIFVCLYVALCGSLYIMLKFSSIVSGLDSTAASSLMKTLRMLANRGLTIVTSIHQPSTKVFYSFDALLLLAGGRTAYFGPPRDCMGHLAALGFKAQMDYNPADFVMDIINGVDNTPESLDGHCADEPLSRYDGSVLVKRWEGRELSETLNSYLDARPLSLSDDSTHADVELGVMDSSQGDTYKLEEGALVSGYESQYSTQFMVLTERSFKNAAAAWLTPLNALQCIAISLMAGFAWFQLPRTESSIPARSGYIFFYMVHWFFVAAFGGLLGFFPEKPILAKERASGSYRLSAYLGSKFIAESPMTLALPMVFLAITYPMANMNHDPRSFFGLFAAQLLATNCGESMGIFVASAVGEIRIGAACVTVLALFFMLVGGFYVKELPYWLRWCRYLSPIRYSYDACVLFEFSTGVSCDGSGIIKECSDPGVSSASTEAIIDYLGASGAIGFNVAMIAAGSMFFRLLAYIVLRSKQLKAGPRD